MSEIVELYKDGLSGPKIAAKLNVGLWTVYRTLERAGVQRDWRKPVREESLWCATCSRWLPDDGFHVSSALSCVRRRGRATKCRDCETRGRMSRVCGCGAAMTYRSKTCRRCYLERGAQPTRPKPQPQRPAPPVVSRKHVRCRSCPEMLARATEDGLCGFCRLGLPVDPRMYPEAA